ncbi:MAG: hypothetical protein MJK10_03880 [Pseudomonadales bacterium]|nr:hypothetical protein [Pseudomonadales bacterium]NRA15211.1 hypothetical protein [Oceanospirillaceae bacterium]
MLFYITTFMGIWLGICGLLSSWETANPIHSNKIYDKWFSDNSETIKLHYWQYPQMILNKVIGDKFLTKKNLFYATILSLCMVLVFYYIEYIAIEEFDTKESAISLMFTNHNIGLFVILLIVNYFGDLVSFYQTVYFSRLIEKEKSGWSFFMLLYSDIALTVLIWSLAAIVSLFLSYFFVAYTYNLNGVIKLELHKNYNAEYFYHNNYGNSGYESKKAEENFLTNRDHHIQIISGMPTLNKKGELKDIDYVDYYRQGDNVNGIEFSTTIKYISKSSMIKVNHTITSCKKFDEAHSKYLKKLEELEDSGFHSGGFYRSSKEALTQKCYLIDLHSPFLPNNFEDIKALFLFSLHGAVNVFRQFLPGNYSVNWVKLDGQIVTMIRAEESYFFRPLSDLIEKKGVLNKTHFFLEPSFWSTFGLTFIFYLLICMRVFFSIFINMTKVYANLIKKISPETKKPLFIAWLGAIPVYIGLATLGYRLLFIGE